MDIAYVVQGEKDFKEAENFCVQKYRECGILTINETFSLHPDYFILVRDKGEIKATVGIFERQGHEKLPLEHVLQHNRTKCGNKIEISRLAYHKLPKSKSEYAECLETFDALLDELFQRMKIVCKNSKIFFETHQTILKIINRFFDPAMFKKLNVRINWQNVPKESIGFYRKFLMGDACLFLIDNKIFQKNHLSFRKFPAAQKINHAA